MQIMASDVAKLRDLKWEMETASTIFEDLIGETCVKKSENESGRTVNVRLLLTSWYFQSPIRTL
jgi:hypothetical protein